MIVKLSNGGQTRSIEVAPGTEVGHVRSFEEELEDIGAPGTYTLAIDGQGVDDNVSLQSGCTVTFRPVQGNKG